MQTKFIKDKFFFIGLILLNVFLLCSCDSLMSVITTVNETQVDEEFLEEIKPVLEKAENESKISIEPNEDKLILKYSGDDIKISSVQQALAILKVEQDKFGIKNFSYTARTTVADKPNERCVELRQLHKGIQIAEGGYKCTFSSENKLISIEGKYADVTVDSVNPKITLEEAKKASKLDERTIRIVGLIISDDKLVWKIKTSSGYYTLIDANTGEIIKYDTDGNFVA